MDNRKKVPLKNKLAYGIGTGGGNVFSQIAAAFLLNYYTDTALIGAGAIATMFLVCRVFDGITDLLMGGIVDKTSTRLGKARPWLIASAPLSLLGIVLLMNVPMGLGENGKLVYAYITYIFMSCIVYTIYGISNTALLPLMTHDKDDSTMLATFSALGNNIIGLIAGSLITPLVLNLGWKTSSIILGFAACVLILISGLLNKEMVNDEDTKKMAGIPMSQQLPATLKNKYFWLLLLLGAFSLIMNANAIGAQIYYCNMVLGNPMFMSVLMTAGQLPGIFILFFMPAVSKKWNKKNVPAYGSGIDHCGICYYRYCRWKYNTYCDRNCDPLTWCRTNPLSGICTCPGCGTIWRLEIWYPFRGTYFICAVHWFQNWYRYWQCTDGLDSCIGRI